MKNFNNKMEYNIIGMMSGTSCDGVDLVLVKYFNNNNWQFDVLKTQTFAYSHEWKNLLNNAFYLKGEEIINLNFRYSHYLSDLIREFLSTINANVDFISMHGHTIWHNPAAGYTYQLGHGGVIASDTSIPVICDFRSQDVGLGGEGAPLVPIGEKYLFTDYSVFLNLGGFSNATIIENREIISAFDICPVNIILNYVTQKINLSYDNNGELARNGLIVDGLLTNLLKINDTFDNHSLCREIVEKEFIPIIDKYADQFTINDLLRTIVEYVSITISNKLPQNGRVLASGGGAHNKFLIERLTNLYDGQIIIPNKEIIDYKEAIIFAFLGLLRWIGLPNTSTKVTHSAKESCSGAIYLP
ncbi:MAG TPA: anhydro-N-acetylmuramic acid kinase [Bacteroidales bacterium]|nr:anhydro-N-acetylmuramic acid kinase [Bacteroidales bacterium]